MILGNYNNTNIDFKQTSTYTLKGTMITAGTNVYDSTNYTYSGVTMALGVHSLKQYSANGKFEIYTNTDTLIGTCVNVAYAVNGSYPERGYEWTNISCTNVAAALQATSFYIKAVGTGTSSTANFANFRTGPATSSTTYGGTAGVRHIRLKITYTATSKNTAPPAPSITYPASAGQTTYNTKPYFQVKTGNDANGDTQTIQWKIDSGSWANMKTGIANNGGSTGLVRYGTALSAGSHTVYFRAYDGKAYGSEVSRTFTVATPAAVSSGKIDDDNSLDVYQVYVKNQCAYYGISKSFTARNSPDKILASDIKALEDALESCPSIATTYMTSPAAGASAKLSDTFTKLRDGLLQA